MNFELFDRGHEAGIIDANATINGGNPICDSYTSSSDFIVGYITGFTSILIKTDKSKISNMVKYYISYMILSHNKDFRGYMYN